MPRSVAWPGNRDYPMTDRQMQMVNCVRKLANDGRPGLQGIRVPWRSWNELHLASAKACKVSRARIIFVLSKYRFECPSGFEALSVGLR